MDSSSPLPASWDVPQVFHDRMGDRAGRQRLMVDGEHLLFILHAPPLADDLARTGRFFWRKPDGAWETDVPDEKVASLDAHLDQYDAALHLLDEAVVKADRANEHLRVLQSIAPLLRASRNMQTVMQQAREANHDDRNLIVLRDRAVQIERTAELLQADAQNGLDAAIARRAEEQAESTALMAVAAHRLNILLALFFPLATVAAVFGMNFKHGLEETFAPWLFWILLAIFLSAGFVLKSIVSRKPKEARLNS
jgi:hypothetical protein